MNIKLEMILIGFLLLYAVLSIFWILTTEKRLKRFFMGKKAKDLEDTIEILEDQIKKLNENKMRTSEELININSKLRKSIRGLETVRFNPFSDQGSNQSFAISFLNEDEDGVVISSLYSRERTSIFAKPIKNGKSEYELTEEEKVVLSKAKI